MTSRGASLPRIYRFDDVEMDLANFRVQKAGKPVSLEPKALNVLVFLVENRGRLIEKRELLDAVWGQSFVTENVLTRAIAQVRKALADDAAGARYIETVPTRGYRFVADVIVIEPPAAEDASTALSAAPATPPSPATAPPQPAATRISLRRRLAIAAAALLALAGLAAATKIFRSRSGDLQIIGATQITTSTGLSFYPTFSPDATEIAYSSDRGKGFEIFVRQLVPGGKEFQITSDGNQNFQPAWSADGTLIAYHSRIRGGIWLVPAQGGTSRKLTDFGSRPAWSRDGQWIAFQSNALDDLGADSMDATPPSTIWMIRSDGSSLAEVTDAGIPEGGHGSPSWSPDGRHIVFVSSISGGSRGVWAIGMDRSGLVRLANPAPAHFDPVYAPDGKSVIYGAVAPGQNFGLWQVPVSPDSSATLGAPSLVNNTGGIRIKHLAFSSDGKKLLYAAVGITGSLQSLPVSSAAEPTGDPIPLTSQVGCREILPAFSPDGSRIAFVSCRGRAGISQQIWIMNSDGSNLQQLTYPPNSAAYPSWFPDGRRIVVNAGPKDLVSVDTETRQQEVLARLSLQTVGHRLSPDGSRLATFSMEGGIMNTWMMDMATGSLKQITFDKEMAAFPAWSPDGKWLAIEIQRGAENQIYVMPSIGGTPTQVTYSPGQHWLYSWSPDGEKLIFAKLGPDLLWNVWSVSRSTKIEKQLTHYTHTNAYVRYPQMSPRANQIVYEYTETTGNIWMLQFK